MEEQSRIVATKLVAMEHGVDADWLAEHTVGAPPEVMVKIARDKARLEAALREARESRPTPAAATGRPDSGGGAGSGTSRTDVYKQFMEQGKGDIAGYLDALDRLGISG